MRNVNVTPTASEKSQKRGKLGARDSALHVEDKRRQCFSEFYEFSWKVPRFHRQHWNVRDWVQKKSIGKSSSAEHRKCRSENFPLAPSEKRGLAQHVRKILSDKFLCTSIEMTFDFPLQQKTFPISKRKINQPQQEAFKVRHCACERIPCQVQS